jgi:diguanylate cyclase (GGDEF)-like protein
MAHRIATRSAFEEEVGTVLAAEGGSRTGALLVADIDEWAAIADRRGSEFAGVVAAAVAKLWLANLREPDLLVAEAEGRILVFLPEVNAEEGRQVAERLAGATRLHVIHESDGKATLRVTTSVGVSAAPEHGRTVAALYAAANAACVRIASQGKDGAGVAPLPHHEALHRPLGLNRFAGRAAELTLLVEKLDAAAAGKPQVVGVTGPLGAGSANLLRQLEPEVRLRGGAFVFAASAEHELPVPYAPWISILRALSRLDDQDARGGPWRELQNLVPEVSSDPPDRHAGSQYRLLEEIARFVRESARERPVVVVLDEMQWADSTTWDVLEHLVQHMEEAKLLVAITARTERQFSEATERRQLLAKNPPYRGIDLSALTRDEVKQWMEAAFHRQPIGRDFLAYAYRQTEGNPLLISQLLRVLLEEGALWHTRDRWEWTPVSELRVPSGMSALIAHRLARFSSSTQAVLTTAAVIGPEFDIATLVAARAGSEAALRPALAEALAAGMLRPSVVRRQGTFSFAHERILSSTLDLLPRDRLVDVHGRVAQAKIARNGWPPAEVASHSERAGDHAQAYDYAIKAAEEAERLYAYAAAKAHLKLAARCAPSPALLAETRRHLARLAEIGGHFDEVEELCDLAIEWFAGQGDQVVTLDLKRRRQSARMAQGQPARVTYEALVELDREASDLGIEHERVAVLGLMADALARMGDRGAAQRVGSRCVEMAERVGDATLLADSLLQLGRLVSWEDNDRSISCFRRALSLFEESADIRGQARCYNGLGVFSEYANRIDDAVKSYANARSIARGGGVLDVAAAAASNLGVLAHRRGHYDQAREFFSDAMASFAAVKNTQLQLMALYNLAHTERAAGAWLDAQGLYATTVPLAQRIGQADIEVGAIAGEGLSFMALGKHDLARERLDQVAARIATRPEWFQGREICDALSIRVAAAEGRWGDAFGQFESAIALAESSGPWQAVWLAAECAPALLPRDTGVVRDSIGRFSTSVDSVYPAMTTRYAALLATAPGS